jgi:N-acetyl-1-D-myo-inositol-2-amino-2-deoxy-alpha-D-glucopyranoside deacetylase
MVWGDAGRRAVAPERLEPGSFWAADLRDAADDLVPVLREVRPHVVVTYDDNGGYGHPDHIKAHRVTTYAVALSAVASYRPDLGAPWPVPKVYWTAMPRSLVQRGIEALRETASPHHNLDSPDDLGYVVDDELVDAVVDGSAHLDRKIAAMQAHASQMTVGDRFFALSDNVGQGISGHEHYRLAQGRRDPGIRRPEPDLFAGIEV